MLNILIPQPILQKIPVLFKAIKPTEGKLAFLKCSSILFLKKIEVEDCNLKIKVPTVAGCGELVLYKFFRAQIFQWLS